jgi:hypothetical protein
MTLSQPLSIYEFLGMRSDRLIGTVEPCGRKDSEFAIGDKEYVKLR